MDQVDKNQVDVNILVTIEFPSLSFTPEEVFPDGVPEDFTEEDVKNIIRDYFDEFFFASDASISVDIGEK